MKLFFLCIFSLLLIVGFAQSKITTVDSLQDARVGFNTLFTITPTGKKDKPFQFELNKNAIAFIQSYIDKQGPELLKMKNWAKPYFNLYDEILTANGIPVQLKYLSVIESHLTPNLVSWAGAVGPWQLMPDEAKRFGLKTSPVDERTDFQKSTIAAATILKELFTQFGDWLLVVAAYNGGAGRVSRAIQKKGTKDFWQIEYELPMETRNHVKKFIATEYIMEENATAFDERGKVKAFDERGKVNAFDERGKNLISSSANDWVSTEVSGRFLMIVIAKKLSLPITDLIKVNPAFDQQVASGHSYMLKLPKDKLPIFETYKNDILQASLQMLYTIKE